MDLLRVSKTALQIGTLFDDKLVKTFLDKAKLEFKKIDDFDRKLLTDLHKLSKKIPSKNDDPIKRIRWGEKIMTIASRMSLE